MTVSMAKLRFTLAGVLVFALFGCVTPDRSQIGPFPSNYKEIIKQTILKSYYDPYSIRSAAISYPQTGHLFFQQGWIVCVEANAKNRLGGYVGLKQTAYLLHNGTIVGQMQAAPLCQQVSYQPWPALEKL